MGQFAMRRSFDAPVDVVWDVVADHALYGTVAPNLARVEVVAGEGEGMVRRCIDTDGNEWTETCRRWDDGRGFEMVVDVAGSDFHRRLFDRFEGSWSLEDREEDVLVTVAFEFEPKYGPLGWLLAKYLEYKAPALVEPIFDGWAAAIEARRRDVETKSKADAGTEAEADAEAKAETDAEAKAETDAEAKAETDAEAKAETETEAKAET